MKERLDVILTKRGDFASREKARAAIMAGIVYVDGQRCDKPGTGVAEGAEIEVRGNDCPYVSRGGYKLEKALSVFAIDAAGKVCIDIGASTGGFTDCLLQHGAARVYSVDVGYGQLDWKLRNDPRVVCMEKVNFRYMKPEDIPEKLDLACADVSFISLKHMFPAVRPLLKDGAELACLVKPQFEAGREQVGKNGIVRDPAVHREVIARVDGYAHACGFASLGVSFSPVRGAKGNVEYLLHLRVPEAGEAPAQRITQKQIEEAVSAAHLEFHKEDGTDNG